LSLANAERGVKFRPRIQRVATGARQSGSRIIVLDLAR
jgi:hypothetical protein